jgi:hypothetical protein
MMGGNFLEKELEELNTIRKDHIQKKPEQMIPPHHGNKHTLRHQYCNETWLQHCINTCSLFVWLVADGWC